MAGYRELPPDPRLPYWALLAYEAIIEVYEARGQAATTREAYEAFTKLAGRRLAYRKFVAATKLLAEDGVVERVVVSLGRYGRMAVLRPLPADAR